MISSILITSSESRPHLVYEISVKSKSGAWTVWRRYSDFQILNSLLPNLPPKLYFTTDAALRERKEALELYLQSILYHKDASLKSNRIFLDFLAAPEQPADGLASSLQNWSKAPDTNTPQSWLLEHDGIKAVLNQTRVSIHSRQTLSDNVNALQTLNAQIRKTLALGNSRLSTLEKSLDSAQVSLGEKSRRLDLVMALKQDMESVSSLFAAPTSRMDRVSTSSSQNRLELFKSNSNSSLTTSSSKESKSTRKFGKAPVETDETRSLDNQGVLSLQNVMIQQQDEALDQLSLIIARQKEIGQTIGNELELQNQMLDDLDGHVSKVDSSLKVADKKVKRLLKG